MVTPGTPPIPHVGGPVSIGCPTVLIGMMPAARVGDMAVCVGPPDTIAKGSMTVMIGGMPAARIGDLTVHGGVVAMGCPTVIIGDVGMGAAGSPRSQPPGSSQGSQAAGHYAAAGSAAPPRTSEPKGKDDDDPIVDGKIAYQRDIPTSWAKTLKDGKWKTDDEELKDSGKPKLNVEATHDWVNKDDAYAAKKWGDDNANVKLISAGYVVSSGISYTKGDGVEIDAIKAAGHGEVASASGKGGLFNDVLTGEAQGKVLSAEGEASLGASWTDKAKDVHAKIGGSADLVKVEGSGKINIPLFGHTLSVGLGGEGEVGVSAEAGASAGYNQEDGWHVGAKAKAGLGLGGGVNFLIGFK
jgi:uncharacterized Zn-binding protein involved in type VI secretion